MHLSRNRKVAATLLGSALLTGMLAGCGSASTGTSGGSGPFAAAKGCKTVGVSLPETNSSPRWEAYDHPDLVAALKQDIPGVTILYANANGSATQQQTDVESMLTKGACILIVAPHDSSAAASIVASAKQQKVPVIAYDRLIQSNDLAYYVSFDNYEVGVLQGQYIANNYTKYEVNGAVPNIAFIKGAQTDNNAILFANGAHSVLDPLINAGKMKKVYETFTPNWDPPTGETEMEAALTANNNNIQLVYSANDDLGGAIITALTAQHLQGKVLVTGQDATVPGIQRILEGTQAMTIYKPISKEAGAAAQVAAALSQGTSTASLTNGKTIATQGGANIPSVLETPISVDQSNVASTVIKDGYVTAAQVCPGLPAGTNSQGICS